MRRSIRLLKQKNRSLPVALVPSICIFKSAFSPHFHTGANNLEGPSQKRRESSDAHLGAQQRGVEAKECGVIKTTDKRLTTSKNRPTLSKAVTKAGQFL
jgi:hypothetical protein